MKSGRLIETVNNMLERTELSFRGLEETNAAQRRFVSDAFMSCVHR